jgi:NCS2 family nucleobase:cation symporter-2
MRPGMKFLSFAAREADRPTSRPHDLLSAPGDAVTWPVATAMAFQHLAIQSIYIVLPVAVAASMGLDARMTANFLCLSLLAMAILTLLQATWRGPVGSGYQLHAIPSPILVGVYLLCGAAGIALDQAAALVLISGAVAVGILFLIPRPERIFPSELAGVVIFLLGASLIPVMVDIITEYGRLDTETLLVDIALAGFSFVVMVTVSLSRLPIARFGVLIGAVVGVVLTSLISPERLHFAAAAGANTWFALPAPILPRFEGLSVGLVIMFIIPVLPGFTAMLGNLIALQRAADGGWTKPDSPPLWRGLLAFNLAIFATGTFGGMAPSPSMACTALSIANRSLSRRIAVLGAAILCLLALSPKLVAVLGAVPSGIEAAMLLYVASIMMVTGVQLITARMLDTRRSLVAGTGLVAGILVLTMPSVFRQYVPALASPLSLGSLTALLAHLLTLPLVARQVSLTFPVGPNLPRLAEEEAVRLGGAWAARRATMEKVENCLIELGEVMALRDESEIRAVLRYLEGEVSLVVKHQGGPLPAPSSKPAVLSLDGDMDDQLGFILWLAVRQASTVDRRPGELRLIFNDT